MVVVHSSYSLHNSRAHVQLQDRSGNLENAFLEL